MFDYRLLSALAAVIDEGGFDRAASALGLTQSAVSQRIKLLEDRLGQLLLIRATPPRPTPAGQALLKHFRQVRLLENDLPLALLPETDQRPTPLPLGINADTLATWFWPAISPFLQKHAVLLDLRVDDQDVTHRMLRDGEVVGCVSASERPMQGCRARYLGTMDYRLYASPEFIQTWFPQGMSLAAVKRAPAAIFSRNDALQHRLLTRALGEPPGELRAHFVPSSEAFVTLIAAGQAFGAIPEQQSSHLVSEKKLVDLAPDGPEPVHLYWHCWNLTSPLLDDLSRALEEGAKSVLRQI